MAGGDSVHFITGKDYHAIQAAIPEAQKKNLDLNLYKIIVDEEKAIVDGKPGSSLVVLFIDLHAEWPSAAHRGNPGNIPGVEVTLDPDTLKVRSASFIR